MATEKVVSVIYKLTRQTTGKPSTHILSLKVRKEGVLLELNEESEELTWGQLKELDTIIGQLRSEFDPNLPKAG